MKLRNNSYMDVKTCYDINVNFSDKDDKLYDNLLLFYNLHELTKKWHKNDYYQQLHLKNNISDLDVLKKYYINCFLEVDNIKIKRLNNNIENSLDLDEQLLYLKELRLYDDIKIKNNKFEFVLNPILQKVMSLSRIASHIKVKILNKNIPSNPNNNPIIFVLSHVGKDDQVVFNEAIKKHYTILSGDYENLHNNIEGIVTKANGVLFFDMNSKDERREIINRVSDKLSSGDNILCSMEAAWNISANSIVNKLFPGMVFAALKSNALILPVAIERFDKELYSVNVSDVFFDPSSYFKNKDYSKNDIIQYTEMIRQKLADLKYQTFYDDYIFKKINIKRTELGTFEEENEKFINGVLSGWNFDKEDIRRKGFIDKESPDYAFLYIVNYFENKINKMNEYNYDELVGIYSDLCKQIKNPVYPNSIINKLKDIKEQFDYEFYNDRGKHL